MFALILAASLSAPAAPGACASGSCGAAMKAPAAAPAAFRTRTVVRQRQAAPRRGGFFFRGRLRGGCG